MKRNCDVVGGTILDDDDDEKDEIIPLRSFLGGLCLRPDPGYHLLHSVFTIESLHD